MITAAVPQLFGTPVAVDQSDQEEVEEVKSRLGSAVSIPMVGAVLLLLLVLPLAYLLIESNELVSGGASLVAILVADQPQEKFSPQMPAEERYYTGLQVTRDPGVWLVYSGFILMIAGCFVTFYLSHQQVCIVIEQLRKNSRVTFAGIANRNKLAMKNAIEKIFSAMTES